MIQLLVHYLRPFRRELLAVVFFQLIGTIATLYLPSLNAEIIDRGVATGDTRFILTTGGWMLLVTVVNIACTIAGVYFGARAAMGFGRDLRSGVFSHVGTFSAREMARFGAPSLITRTTNDVQQIQMLVLMTATMMVAAPIMCVGGIIMALRQDVGLSWLMLVAVPVLALAIHSIIREMIPGFRVMQDKIDGINRVLREQISGARVVRAFVREPFESNRFDRANADLTATALSVGRLMSLIFPTVMLVLNVSSVAVLWFGAGRVESGQMAVGSLTAFLAYLMQILMSVMMATFMFMMVPRAAASSDRIRSVLDTETSVVPPVDPITEITRKGEVEFSRVTFRYPGADEPVLKEVSFVARAGETTAVIGSTGSGKSTLLNLIPRLFDVTEGEVSVNGVDVRRLDPDQLWGNVGLVPQKAYLFTGTIASNLRYGNPEAPDHELWDALEVAQAADFVRALSGLDAAVAQGGSNFSGGQRQRLAIARALVRKPDIYLFDDSFSAVDLGTDARLRNALRPVTAAAAVVVVAQRVATIRNADQIIVLEDGQVMGIGRHDQLLASCPTYAEIVESQAGIESAA